MCDMNDLGEARKGRLEEPDIDWQNSWKLEIFRNAVLAAKKDVWAELSS